MSDAITAVRRFFDGLDTASWQDGADFIAANVTDDFVWENTGLPTVKGPDAAREFYLGFAQFAPMVGVKVDWKAIAAEGATVVTERVDYMVDAAGETLIALPIAGTLEVAADGKIAAWRDYFDPRPFFAPENA